MSLRSISFVTLLVSSTAIASPTVAVTAAPPIDAAPTSGLDPDVAGRLDAAERELAGAPAAALDGVLVLFESPDPFSVAQRELAKPHALEILGRIGERARASGQLELAARAFDARHTIAGDPHDPQLARALLAWGERAASDDPGHALYLARRAEVADPTLTGAVQLDHKLARNHRLWSGRVAILVGVAAVAVGIWARSQVGSIESDLASHPRPGDQVQQMLNERDVYDAVGTGLMIGGPILSFGGLAWMISGQPSYTASSPAELPALGAP